LAEEHKIYKVLLSSPNDVQEERKLVEDCVAEVNSILNRLHLGIKLWKWEKDSFSSIGNSGQDVINTQLGRDYDIYLGVLWSKLGSPTDSLKTGTEDEFQNALEIYSTRTSDFDIKFYFSNIEIPNHIYNEYEINKVKDFKKRVQESGVLTKDYNNLNEFQSFVRLGLTHKIFDWNLNKIELDVREVEDVKQQTIKLHIEFNDVSNKLIIAATKFQNTPVEFTRNLNKLESKVKKMSIFEVKKKGRKLLEQLNRMMEDVFESASIQLNNQTFLFKLWIDKYTDLLLLACSLPTSDRNRLINSHLEVIQKMKKDFLINAETGKAFKDLAYRMKKIHTKLVTGAEKGVLFAEQFSKSYYFYFSMVEICEQKVRNALN
jgi:hypothetical protein